MQPNRYYTIMPDGTVKQVNPFTGTEVWAVAGRKSRPITNEVAAAARPLEPAHKRSVRTNSRVLILPRPGGVGR